MRIKPGDTAKCFICETVMVVAEGGEVPDATKDKPLCAQCSLELAYQVLKMCVDEEVALGFAISMNLKYADQLRRPIHTGATVAIW